MNWKDLLQVKAWTSLQNISDTSLKLGDELFQIEDNVFVIAQPYDMNFNDNLPNAPFVTLAYWAPSVEAIKYCVSHDVELNNYPSIEPPFELLLETNGCYGELLKLASSTSERAIYRGTDGTFVHKVIELKNKCFFFLDKDIDYSQKPYAIEVSLPD